MTLDIIVPHYKEPWARCQYLFDSIAMQRGVRTDEFRVILVNDGSDVVFDQETLNRYPFKIDYILKSHEGVSAARNAGLDHSDAEYVMFCDDDDGFLSNYGLYMVFSAIAEGFDLLVSNFIEETLAPKDNTLAIVGHDQDLTFMHGKVYRRQFLLDNDLRFDPSMTLHEDGYFNMLTHIVCTKTGGVQKAVKTPFYIWCWNGESTVRKEREDFTLRTYRDVMKTRIGLCRQIRNRGYDDELEISVLTTVMNSYYDFQKTAWLADKNRVFREIAERAFKEYWNEFGKIFKNATNMKIAEVAILARQTATKNGMLLEQQDLKSFLRHIERDVK